MEQLLVATIAFCNTFHTNFDLCFPHSELFVDFSEAFLVLRKEPTNLFSRTRDLNGILTIKVFEVERFLCRHAEVHIELGEFCKISQVYLLISALNCLWKAASSWFT